MIKVVALLKRRPELTLEAFCDYYEHHHAPLFQRTIPVDVANAIVHYVQNHAMHLGGGTSGPPFDCVTEMGFADLAGVKVWTDWYYSEDGKVLRDDEETFMDPAQRVVVMTTEHDLGTAL
jgi:EthD domain